jgi:fructosamine-3-kinase
MPTFSLSRDELHALAVELAPLIAARLHERESPSGWMGARAAADYAGCTVAALHKATASRQIRFSQESAGGKLWFRREWIDAWRGDG